MIIYDYLTLLMIIDDYSLFLIHVSLFIIPYPCFIIHYSLSMFHYSLFLIHVSLFIIPYPCFIIHYSVPRVLPPGGQHFEKMNMLYEK